jgi:hypothetical protein
MTIPGPVIGFLAVFAFLIMMEKAGLFEFLKRM